MQQNLGDYKIIKQIGQGSLGMVLLVEHRFIKKQYVLKILPEELSQDVHFVSAFEQEVGKLAQLEHPHIVKIHNVSYADGRYFLVTDCIVDDSGNATNLGQYLSTRKDPLKEEELLNVVKQIAQALDFAHSKGHVIHRSLKFNNILIGKNKNGLEVFISDFGLSKMISPGRVMCRTFKILTEALEVLPVDKENEEKYSVLPLEAGRLSKLSHSFLQGFAFLAPEQKRFENVTVHADTYAFGVLVYYLIAKHFPEGIFPLPSVINPDYKYDWDYVVTQCLQQEPMLRPTQLCSLLERELVTSSKTISQSDVSLPIEKNEKEPAFSLEKLKEKLMQSTAKPALEKAFVGAPSSLKPIIKPLGDREDRTEFYASDASLVESKDIAEATPLAMNPIQEESFVQTLNSMLNRDPIVTQYHPEKKESKRMEPLSSEMQVIQGGEFMRGCYEGNRDEIPCHKIFVESFALDIHPVTNEQYVRFLEYMGGEKDQNYNDLIRLKDSRINRSGGRLSIESGYSKHPVVGVTWYGAFNYAKWIGKRLPTEAEWEIACRGGLENSLYPTGDNIEKSQANFFSSDTTPVMSYSPNGYGMYDIVGNVYEWCQDWYGYNYYESSLQEPNNPKGPLQGVYRVLRGGCWKSLKDDLRCSHRHRNNPGTVNSTYGFRCAADVQ